VVREPGVLRGAYPSADLVVVAGLDHVAAAWAAREGELPLDVEPAVFARLQHRYAEHLGGESSGSPPPEECRCRSMEDGTAAGARSADHPPSSEAQHEDGRSSGERRAGPAVGPPWLRRALSAYGVPARLEHVGLLDHQTLELLACNATVRSAVLAPNGAVLDLGRAQRLATPTQKTALLARDGGCVIPGCTVPGDACAAHHVVWWSRGGPTDLGNLALLCGRHHIEVHAGTWEIEMSDGVPWVLPPRWLGVNASALRNAPLGAACARSGDGQHAGHVGAADDEDHDEGDRDHCEHLTPEHESEKGDDDGNGERHDGLQE
jgi:hypothetical protein